MGWCVIELNGRKPDVSFISSMYGSKNNQKESYIVEGSIKRLQTFYGALKIKDLATGNEIITPVVSIVKINQYNVGIKSIGPDSSYIECPERILDLITDTHPSVLKWVEECRANILEKSFLPKICRGMVIKFKNPVNFGVYPVSDLRVERAAGGRIEATSSGHPFARFKLSRDQFLSQYSRGNIDSLIYPDAKLTANEKKSGKVKSGI